MNKNYTDKELLSAYIDGELSLNEKKLIEDKIKTSLELQKELSDLKKIKELTSGSVDRISESPFFETRLFANINTQASNRFNYKKWIPIGSLTLVTLTLMAVSYTHLRAHETVLDLVCRLLLEKKKHKPHSSYLTFYLLYV